MRDSRKEQALSQPEQVYFAMKNSGGGGNSGGHGDGCRVGVEVRVEFLLYVRQLLTRFFSYGQHYGSEITTRLIRGATYTRVYTVVKKDQIN